MIWLLACTGVEPVEAPAPSGRAYTGAPELTEASLECRGVDQIWTAWGRGVAELHLEIDGSWTEADSGDTGPSSVDVHERHELPLSAQDPAGWWSLYELELGHDSQDTTIASSQATCAQVEQELRWSLRLRAGEDQLDCLGDCS